MKKNIFIIILAFLMSVFLPICAETNQNEIHAGTPAGFYDDINPDDLDEDAIEEKSEQSRAYGPTGEMHQFSDDSGSASQSQIVAGTKNYMQIYNKLEVPDFSYLHDIDPDQYYDMKDTTWSVYPLLRLNSAIYFKNITIEPGYYLLTPRENNGKWYILFKQNGLVKHIIPVYERDITPEFFYDEHIPRAKLTTSQKMHKGFLDFVGKAKSSKRKTPVKSYMEINDLDNYMVSIIIYYGNHKYSTLFRTIRL